MDEKSNSNRPRKQRNNNRGQRDGNRRGRRQHKPPIADYDEAESDVVRDGPVLKLHELQTTEVPELIKIAEKVTYI